MLTVWHFISGDLWAGAEVMAYNLLKHLQQHEDLQIHALLLNEGRLSQELKGLGMDVVALRISFTHIASRRMSWLFCPQDFWERLAL